MIHWRRPGGGYLPTMVRVYTVKGRKEDCYSDDLTNAKRGPAVDPPPAVYSRNWRMQNGEFALSGATASTQTIKDTCHPDVPQNTQQGCFLRNIMKVIV